MGKAHALSEQLSENADDSKDRQELSAPWKKSGRSRATHYRHADPAGVALGPVHGPRRPRQLPPSTITDQQRAAVLAVLNSEAYRDLAIPQVWARELDEGRFWCSQSSMYRIARAAGQSRERRAQATHPPRVRPAARACPASSATPVGSVERLDLGLLVGAEHDPPARAGCGRARPPRRPSPRTTGRWTA
ncbi:hypothetical protein [Pseudonocardia humida]|uniref:hypothetical protein n=1 Tax=Pseudonocardia humida TaxID=2800819 RepID=UPI00207C3083|nr:hypothetical protein [Pseudonocardia humida]